MKHALRSAFLLSIALLAGCKPIREVLPFRGEIPARGPEKLLDLVMANRISGVRYYSGKADVEMKAQGKGTFESQGAMKLKSSAQLGLEGAVQAELKGNKVAVSGDMTTTIKGGTVMIN